MADYDDLVKSHKARTDKINAETEAAKNAVKKERSGALIGDVNMPKDPEPWYKNKFMTPSWTSSKKEKIFKNLTIY